MKACQAGGQLHELVPVICSLLAATPILLEVMEDCISRMEGASCLCVFLRDKRTLFATLVGAYKLSVLCHLHESLEVEAYNRVLRGWGLGSFLSFFSLLLLFLLFVEVCGSFERSNALFLDGVGGIGDCARLPELCGFLFLISVRADTAAWEFLKLRPLISDSLAAWPSLLQIVKDWLAWMESACSTIVFCF